MAKMMRKLLALVMVLSMCFSMIALSATAADGSDVPSDATNVNVDIVVEDVTDGDGNVIGTKTTETTTDGDGNVVSTKTTQVVTDQQESETEKTYTQDTQVQTDWTSTQTENTEGTPVQTGTNTTEQTDTNITTEVTGSQTSEAHVHSDKETGVQTYSGSSQGSEETNVTDTTTTTTTTTGDLLSEETTVTTTKDGEVETDPNWRDETKTGEGEWVEDPSNSQSGTYTKDDGSETTTSETTGIDVDTDPLANTDAVLNLKPGKTDEEKLYISIEDALANDITYTEGPQADGSVVTFQRDSSGNIIGYTITKTTPDANNPQDTDPVDPDDITAGQAGAPVNGASATTYTKPDGYTPCTDEPIYDNDGNQIGTRTVKEVLDNNNAVIGYEITEIIESKSASTQGQYTDPVVDTPASFTPPQKPDAPAPVTDQYGMTTTVTVKDILDNDGNLIGYETVTTVTDSEGNVASEESNSVYGTWTSATTTTTHTPETDVTTTTTVTTVYGTVLSQEYTVTTPGTKEDNYSQDVEQEIWQLVNTDSGLYFLYKGQMFAVTAISDKEYSHGDTTMTSLVPNIGALEPGTKDGTVSSTTLLRNPEDFDKDNGIATGYELEYVGYGLESAIRVDYTSGNTLAHQFKLIDRNGNVHYVYCADLGTDAVRGADYNMTNVQDAEYFKRDGAVEMIEAIAISGFWGTDSGVGSLENVKQLLRDAKKAGQISWLPDSYIENLTPGEALTATQAAIWYYGNSSESQNMSNQYVTGQVHQSNGSKRNATGDEASTVNALYQVLIGLDPDKVNNTTTEFIETDNFATETKLTIKDKAKDTAGNVIIDPNSKTETYVTDLTFQMDVKKSSITGNLVITVTDQYGNELAKAQLATTDSNFAGTLLAEDSVGSGTYTLKGLHVAEGVTINLNLEGTQNLNQGVYLYTAAVYSDSQTFVGVGSGQRDVNLTVGMKFDVTDPQAQVKHTESSWSESKTDVTSYTKTDSYIKYMDGTVTDQTQTVKEEVFGTTVVTNVTVSTGKSNKNWKDSYSYTLTTVYDEDGNDNVGDINIFDEEVALADAPKTGDMAVILAVVSLFSAGGLVLLNKKREET